LAEISQAPEARLVFHAEGTAIRPEHHVTEIKLTQMRSLDCGKGEAQWDETLVQLLDGPATAPDNGVHMSARKFAETAGSGLNGLRAPAKAELFFEFGPANSAARKLAVHSIEQRGDTWEVQLGGVSAVCKPALPWLAANTNGIRARRKIEEGASAKQGPCCAPTFSPNTCCDPVVSPSRC
jgi:hypothetical protein